MRDIRAPKPDSPIIPPSNRAVIQPPAPPRNARPRAGLPVPLGAALIALFCAAGHARAAEAGHADTVQQVGHEIAGDAREFGARVAHDSRQVGHVIAVKWRQVGPELARSSRQAGRRLAADSRELRASIERSAREAGASMKRAVAKARAALAHQLDARRRAPAKRVRREASRLASGQDRRLGRRA